MRRVLVATGLALAIGAGLLAAALFYIGTPYFSAWAGTWLTHRSGRNVVLEGTVQAHLLSRQPRIVLTGVKIGNAEWGSEPTMFEASRIEFSFQPLELLRGRVVLPQLFIEQPRILLEKDAQGNPNWRVTENAQAAALKQPLPEKRSQIPIIRLLRITDGKLTYRSPPEHIFTTVDISTISGREEQEEYIHVSGKGTYQQQAFLLDLTGASILQLRDSGTPYPFRLKTTIGPTSASLEGTVQDPIKMEAFDVDLDLKGANASDLFPITGIVLPPTPPYHVSGRLKHAREGDHWHFENFSGLMGNSDLKGDIKWNPSQKPPYMEGSFTSANLDMADLEGFIGAHRKPRDETRIIPDTPMDISRLLAVNADMTFKGERVKRPDILDDFTLKAHLENGTLTLDPVSFGIAGGTISSHIVIAGREDPPEASLDVDFRHLSLHAFFAPLAERYGRDNVSAGLLGGKAVLKGAGKSLRDILATSSGEIGMGMEGGQLSHLLLELVGLDLLRAAGLILTGNDNPVPIQCVIAHFTAAEGVLRTDAFLIDTGVTSLDAEGGVNLASETLDMRLTAHPKKPSLLSARSPIDLKGTLKKPQVSISKAALAARGGLAAALALVAPPAAWLAFIEPGMSKGGNCAAFIRQLREEGAAIPPTGDLQTEKTKTGAP